MNKVLSAYQTSVLDKLEVLGSSQDDLCSVVQVILRSGCALLRRFLVQPPTPNTLASFPALARIYPARAVLSIVVAAEVLKSVRAPPPGALQKFSQHLTPSVLQDLVRGKIPDIEVLTGFFGAFRLAVSPTHRSRTFGEIAADGQLLRGWCTFVSSVLGAFMIDAAEPLQLLVYKADMLALMVEEEQRTDVFVFNLESALKRSLGMLTDSASSWYSQTNILPPPVLTAYAEDIDAALAGFETRAATDLSRFGFLAPSSSVHPPVVSGMNSGKTDALKRTTKSKSDVSSKKVKTSPDGKSSGQGSALPQLKTAPDGSTVSWAKTTFNLPALRAKWDSEHSKDGFPFSAQYLSGLIALPRKNSDGSPSYDRFLRIVDGSVTSTQVLDRLWQWNKKQLGASFLVAQDFP